jgi:tetratricopeptide (TPR) repeat protein
MLLLLCSFKTAAAHVEEGNMPDSVAEMEYRILLEFKPDKLEIRYKLGMVLLRSEKYAEAAKEFEYILKKNRQNVDAYLGLALAKTKLKNYPKAISLYLEALTISPDSMHIYYYFGQALEAKGDFNGAEAVYKDGLAHPPPTDDEHEIEARQKIAEALKKIQQKLTDQPEQNK